LRTTVAKFRGLRELEAENAKLKRMYAELALENTTHIKGCALPRADTPPAKRHVVATS